MCAVLRQLSNNQCGAYMVSKHRLHGQALIAKSTSLDSDTIDKPSWAAGGIVSDMVNALISFKPLFSVMKVGARNTLIDTAEKNGIPWRGHRDGLSNRVPVLEGIRSQIEDASVIYPDYYNQEFHAYDEGNLSWEAAFECEPATLSMAIRTWPKETLSVKQAQNKLRGSFCDAVQEYSQGRQFRKILDVGCSVGVSTYYLCDRYSNADRIDGLDLSPYFLSVAKARQAKLGETDLLNRFGEESNILSDNTVAAAADGFDARCRASEAFSKVNWIHADIGNSGLPDGAYDLVACSFVIHELPTEASNQIFTELFRITSSGGMVALTDIDPTSPVIKNLPPALFTLMKSTEPWSDQYYAFDVKKSLEAAGFTDVVITPTDPRHRTIVAKKSEHVKAGHRRIVAKRYTMVEYCITILIPITAARWRQKVIKQALQCFF